MKKIPLYKFYKHKYGRELLVDVIDIDVMKSDIRKTPNLILSFFCIIIVTDGEEVVGINGRERLVVPKTVICGRPGEVWSWNKDTQLKGMEFIFDEMFLLSFFNDPRFLDRFAYLHANRPSPFMTMDDELFDRLTNLYGEMKREIDGVRGMERDEHMLRAMLYEVLMLLNRAAPELPERERNSDNDYDGTSQQSPSNGLGALRYLNNFVDLVNDNFTEHHDVDFYADKLFITSNYLNKVVRQSLGMSTKQYIQDKLMDEAKQLLKFTTLSVEEIAEQLHYETATYFVRQFSKTVGKTPAKYRLE